MYLKFMTGIEQTSQNYFQGTGERLQEDVFPGEVEGQYLGVVRVKNS